MKFLQGLNARGGQDAAPLLRRAGAGHALLSPGGRLRLHVAAGVAAAGALVAAASVAALNDPRLLTLALDNPVAHAGDPLPSGQPQLAHGLQVSLRAVADGDDLPPLAVRQPLVVADIASTRGLQPAAARPGR